MPGAFGELALAIYSKVYLVYCKRGAAGSQFPVVASIAVA
jgi:hypothetical protein